MSYQTRIMVAGVNQPDGPVRIVPEVALVISHVRQSGAQSAAAGIAPVITEHSIQDKGPKQKRSIGPGKVVSAASLMELMAAHGLRQPMTWCDDSLLAIGSEGFVWHQPPRIASMWWMVGGKSCPLRVRWPHLVFSVDAQEGFRIFAHAGTARPKPTDKLYLPPLGNVYAGGGLCWGNVEPPPRTPDQRQAFEDSVYKTNFTHANARVLTPKAKAGNGDRPALFDYWLRRSGRSPAAVPTEHLARAGKLTLKDLL